MLEFDSLKGETSEIIVQYIKTTVEKNNMDIGKCVAFCAHNANVNFGGVNFGGTNNVYARLKQLKSSNPTLMAIGCPAHIVHNASKHACGQLSYDAEAIVCKILCVHFVSCVIPLRVFIVTVQTGIFLNLRLS